MQIQASNFHMQMVSVIKYLSPPAWSNQYLLQHQNWLV